MGGGGTERFISHLLAGLHNDFEIHLLLFDDLVEYDLPSNQRIHLVENGFKSRSNLSSIARLPLIAFRVKKYCEVNGIKLLFSFLNRPNFTACMAKVAGLQIPLMMNECTYTPAWFEEGDLRGKVAKRMVSWLYPKADVILPVSEGIREALEGYYGVRTRYQVITNVIDRELVTRRMTEEVDGVDFERFTFINVASFSPMKGHRLMIEAFRRLERDDVQLLFVGKGIKFDQTRELVRALGLEKDILFVGFQTNPFKYLARSGCFVLASEFEGQGTVMMEAMACGLPVISTDCKTGPRDLLAPGSQPGWDSGQTTQHGQYGVLVPVDDPAALSIAMREMIERPDLRDQLRTRGYERIRDRTKEVVVGKIRSTIGELLEAHR